MNSTQPKIDQIIIQLKTDNLEQVEEAVWALYKHVDANYSEGNNPLAGYFDIETVDEKITFIEVLDTAIQKHIKNLSDTTLVSIFGMTFKSVGFDNYNAALIVLKEIIARKNSETQKQIINLFYKAYKEYEPGHRFWTDTVHDQLIDTLFPQFSSEALHLLLKKASSDIYVLNNNTGDAIDGLFIPALQNTSDPKLQENILAVFFKYDEEARTDLGQNYFDKLLHEIENTVSPELVQFISTQKDNQKIFSLLEELKEENLPMIIEMLGNKIPKRQEKKHFDTIVKACKKANLPEKSTEKLLNYISKTKQKKYLKDILLTQSYKKEPQKAFDFLTIQLSKNILNKSDVLNIINDIITDLLDTNQPLEELHAYEYFLVNNYNLSYDDVYSIEVTILLDIFFEPNWKYSKRGDVRWVSENLKTIIEKINTEIEYKDLGICMNALLNDGKFQKLKHLFKLLHPKVKQTKEELVLSYNIVAAIMLKDESHFDFVFKEVQKIIKIERSILAYNLACGFAIFDRKNQMLIYIKESIRLEKTKQQFLDDTDFKKYWTDADFLKAIEGK